MLVYNTATGDLSCVDVSKWSGAMEVEGRIYGMPSSANSMLVYDTATANLSSIDVWAVAITVQWSGAVDRDWRILMRRRLYV